MMIEAVNSLVSDQSKCNTSIKLSDHNRQKSEVISCKHIILDVLELNSDNELH